MGNLGKLNNLNFKILFTLILEALRLNDKTNVLYALSISNPALLYQYNFSDSFIVYKENHPNVFYDSMKFFDEINGIAIGDPTDGNCLSILLTNDGGDSWKKSFLPTNSKSS